MMTLFAKSGSLAALAVALAFAAPATAQEMTVQPDDPAPAPAPPPPPPPQPERAYRPMQPEMSSGPARAEIMRSQPEAAPRFERPAPVERPARRFERAAEPQRVFTPPSPPMHVDPDVAARADYGASSSDEPRGRRGRGGFGGDVMGRAEAVQREQQQDRRADPRSVDRSERRPEPPVVQGGWQGQPRGDRPERRPEPPVSQGGWQGDRGGSRGPERRPDAPVVQGGWQGQPSRDGPQGGPPPATGGWQGERRDGVQVGGRGGRDERRDGRVEGRRDESWGGGIRDLDRQSRGEWRGDRDGRRDDRRDGRRDDWRRDQWQRDRDWRRDDWRWSWNGRPGWDSRDYRRWDNRWRDNRSYNWYSYRRSHRVIYQPGPYYAPYRSHRYNRLSIGFYLDSLFFQPRFFINDPWAYRLPPVYGPYQWVRYYDDVLLVDIYSGEVVDVIYDFFW